MDGQDSGSLDQKAFLTLLVELHQSNATGSLKLERAPLQKAVYFRDGQILFAASNDPQDQLASILVDEGKLSKDQMQVAQARVSAGNPLAKVLTELGYISQRELADAARLKVEKILTDLYLWSDGSYQFVERSLPKGAIDLELSTPRLLFNSIRRVQDREWVLGQLGSLDTVLSMVPAELDGFLAATKPDPSAGEVLRLVDGVKSIKQIGSVSALGEFEVCKILVAALQSGALTPSPPALEPETPAAPTRRPASLPFAEDAVAETTALHIGTGGFEPPAAEPFAESPVPLDEAERMTSSNDRPAADFVFDETPAVAAGAERRMPRPRNPRRGARGGGGMNKKVLVALLALILLGGGAAAYYFLWPQGASEGANETASRTPRAPEGPSDTTAGVVVGTTEPTDTETRPGGEETETTEAPPSTTAPPTTAPPTTGPTPTSPPDPTPARPPTTSPSPTSPSDLPPVRPPTTISPSRPGQPMAQGAQQLRSGNYPEAAATFLRHLRNVGADKFTIAVGVFCDTGNVDRVVNNSGGSEELIILAFDNQGRTCYRIFWGIFDSRAEAERAVGSVPAGVRARDSAPVPIDRVLP